MRLFYAFAAVCLMAAPATAETAMTKTHHVPGHEQQTYRFGATYEVSNARSASACQAQCDGAQKCKSWSYLRPVRTSPAYCELKRGTGNPEANPTATSGVSIKSSKYVNASATRRTMPTHTLRGGPSSSTYNSTTTRTYTRPSTAPTVRPTTRPVPRPAATYSTQPPPRTRAPQVTRTTTVINRPGPTTAVKVNQLPRTTTTTRTAAPVTRTTTTRTTTAPTTSYYPKQKEEISRIVTGPTEYYKEEDGKPRYSVQDPKHMIEDTEASVKRPTS